MKSIKAGDSGAPTVKEEKRGKKEQSRVDLKVVLLEESSVWSLLQRMSTKTMVLVCLLTVVF